jgi:hypothetical protein
MAERLKGLTTFSFAQSFISSHAQSVGGARMINSGKNTGCGRQVQIGTSSCYHHDTIGQLHSMLATPMASTECANSRLERPLCRFHWLAIARLALLLMTAAMCSPGLARTLTLTRPELTLAAGLPIVPWHVGTFAFSLLRDRESPNHQTLICLVGSAIRTDRSCH